MRSLAKARLKRIRAVELLAEGYSYDEIAAHVGFSNRGSAHRAVSKALAEREIAAVERLRAKELGHLEELYELIEQRVLAGDLEAVSLAIRMSAQRRRLYGLDGRRPSRPPLSGLAVLVQPWLEGNAREATDAEPPVGT